MYAYIGFLALVRMISYDEFDCISPKLNYLFANIRAENTNSCELVNLFGPSLQYWAQYMVSMILIANVNESFLIIIASAKCRLVLNCSY